MLGLVEHLGLHGSVLDAAKLYVGILAATILFIATNAGVIGASRITYAMASYRQLPGGLPPPASGFKTPWLALVVFAGLISIIVLLPGQTTFLGDMYAFGAMLSFTIAHVSVIALRIRSRNDTEASTIRPSLRIRGIDWPLFAIFGGLGTGIAWIVVVVQKSGPRWAGLGWLAVGLLGYAAYRRYVVRASLTETLHAPCSSGPGPRSST